MVSAGLPACSRPAWHAIWLGPMPGLCTHPAPSSCAHTPACPVQREACADALRQLFAQAMPKLLQHSLDPLSSCARSVVAEFGRQVRGVCVGWLARPHGATLQAGWLRG